MCAEEARCVEQGLSSVQRRVMTKRSVRTKRSTRSKRSTDAAGTKPVSACDKVLRCCNLAGGEVSAAQEQWRVRGRVGSKRRDFDWLLAERVKLTARANGWLCCGRVKRAGKGRREKGKDKKAARPLGWYCFIFSPRQEGTEGMTAGLKWWATRCPSQPPKMNSPNKSDQPVLMKRLVQCRIVMVFHRLSSSWPALVLFLPLRMIHLSSGTTTGTHGNSDPHWNAELEWK